MTIHFSQVDVFALRPFSGNPVAVVLDGRGIDPADMQRIASWTNLSETTFVLPPTITGASYRLRIFTPRQELPFAGHPSVGTAHAMLEAGLATPDASGKLIQQCEAGLLPITIEGEGANRVLLVRVPEPRLAVLKEPDRMALAAALRLNGINAPKAVHVGPVWIVAGIDSATMLRRMQPDFAGLADLSRRTEAVGISLYAFNAPGSNGADATDRDPELVVRSFVPADGIEEDPVCGSGNAAVAAYLRDAGALPGKRYAASQGREIGRDGRVEVSILGDGGICIGGRAVTRVHGHLVC